MRFQLILWDNDGVLVNTERYYLQASREALSTIGLEISEKQFAKLSLAAGRSIFDIAEDAGATQAEISRLKVKRNNRYNELLEDSPLEIDGAKETLKTLHGKLKMAIVTSSLSQHFHTIHKRTGFLEHIDFYLTREDYGQSKPSAEPYLHALKRSRQNKEDVLVIEDSPRGLAAAKNAGLTCWVIPNRYSEKVEFASADKILNSIREIPGEIL